MTRNKDAAQRFWANVDVAIRRTPFNLYDLSEATKVPYKSFLSWRQKHLFPDLETAALIARKLSCSIDKLMDIEPPQSIADQVYKILETSMPGTLQDIMENINKKADGSSGTMAG